ncbi:hypothetical protein [Halalkalirubrum salinum]|uniref:hypothetical protein n=1 Tax=Halalkalirubrum salinum TaxID=2563889 RepID=UPI002AA2AEFB|nr:hypothetical protein [Halalkalirubrum salinum]
MAVVIPSLLPSTETRQPSSVTATHGFKTLSTVRIAMTDRCPLLEYRSEHGDRDFAVDRAFCTAVDRFVQPMRADICNGRYDLSHASDCEFYDDYYAKTDKSLLEQADDESGDRE